MPRLSADLIAQLPIEVTVPTYDRSRVARGVVHLGIGAFHRAHQAAIFDDVLQGGDLRWGITAASLRSGGVRDQLAPQDGLYLMIVRDGGSEDIRLIGAVQDVIVAPEDPEALIAALAARDTHIVTLTITEKGYKLDPATGHLIENDPQLNADLASLNAPETAIGYLVAGLARRRSSGLPGLTIISCDNLPHNGTRLGDAVTQLARAHEAALAEWILARCSFPQTMVDRIVPATTSEDIALLADRLGIEDRAMVKTEPFVQWIVEDRFCGPRPVFGPGVQLTDAVEPWEEAKLRLLNGAHSAIAYLGGLAGIEYVHQFLALPSGRRFVEKLWDEAQSTLSPPEELNLPGYRHDLMARFGNPTLMHRTRQIAMDGSQKLPQRLLATALARIRAGRPTDALSLGIAGWIRWQAGQDDDGRPHDVEDPLASAIGERLATCRSPAERIDALLAYDAVFPVGLRSSAEFRTNLVGWLDMLERQGARAALDMFRRDHE